MTALTPDKQLFQRVPPPDVSCEEDVCYHCGEACGDQPVAYDGKCFCCVGCRMVYQILQQNDMCRYYELDRNPGVSLKGRRQERYEFLDDEEVKEALLEFRAAHVARVTFHLPQIHCASCVWLLEHLYRLREGILQSRVHFMKKELSLSFDPSKISLRQLVELLASVGYPPVIHLAAAEGRGKPRTSRRLLYQIGVAGFAFGNVMLLSFPEYLGLDLAAQRGWVWLFGYLNLLLSLPVLWYSGVDYLRSAWQGLRMRQLNLDVPISLGMVVLFGRSTYEVLTHTGPGYFDSLAGLVFFLLVGKWYQQKTWQQLAFDRDYKSWLPLAATLIDEHGRSRSVPVRKLKAGDRIRVRHGELVPADGILREGQGLFDYSFVTGEADPQPAAEGEKVFAGARQVGGAVELELTRAVEQSYLTRLWNEQSFAHKQVRLKTEMLADRVGKWFTLVILLLATSALAYWWPRDVRAAIDAFTAVLIIACPCAVALAIPFTFGNALRILGRNRFYLKDTTVIERLQQVTAVVFDKTGTLTTTRKARVRYEGEPLSDEARRQVAALAAQSAHPMSRMVVRLLGEDISTSASVLDFREVGGQGVEANVDGVGVRLGSAAFVGAVGGETSEVWVRVGEAVKGRFVVEPEWRRGFEHLVTSFRKEGKEVWLLSGDNERDASVLASLFGESHMAFRQKPEDKLAFIRRLQAQGHRVLMLGDGLNDAGALRQADVGIAVTEDITHFTPASDAILDGRRLADLPRFLSYMRRSVRSVYQAYGLAALYNVVGQTYAVQAMLSPVIAAVLMPASSVTIVAFGVGVTVLIGWRMGLWPKQ